MSFADAALSIFARLSFCVHSGTSFCVWSASGGAVLSAPDSSRISEVINCSGKSHKLAALACCSLGELA
jgi:hypothetical protein